MTSSGIASRWKELSGYGDGGRPDKWAGLLTPLDNDLRRYIIHYGERTGAAGDMFNAAKNESKSPKENFFSDACLVKGNNFEYTVTDFIYAGSTSTILPVPPAWFGYVAVSTDKGKAALGRRDILVVWRGTVKQAEWINNGRFGLSVASSLFGTETQVKVHTGFLNLYTGTTPNSATNKTSAREQVRSALERLLNQYLHEEVSITVTGFSLGAALATLNAMDIVANGYNKPTGNPLKSFKVTAFVFGGPRVGDSSLGPELTRSSNLRLMRITNERDPVPNVPTNPYVHLGEELKIRTTNSPFLKWKVLGRSADDEQDGYLDPTTVPEIPAEGEIPEGYRTGRGLLDWKLPKVVDFVSAHNMDVYLHGVAGVVANNGFSLDKDNGAHDYVLVNKYLNRLKPEYQIPAYWWEGPDRQKMEQLENGRWRVKK